MEQIYSLLSTNSQQNRAARRVSNCERPEEDVQGSEQRSEAFFGDSRAQVRSSIQDSTTMLQLDDRSISDEVCCLQMSSHDDLSDRSAPSHVWTSNSMPPIISTRLRLDSDTGSAAPPCFNHLSCACLDVYACLFPNAPRIYLSHSLANRLSAAARQSKH